MPQRLTNGDKLLIGLSVLILLFVAASCAGAEWCRNNYYCGDAATKQYANDCATNGIVMFFRLIYCWFHSYRDDINAFATAILAFFTIVLAIAARRQAILTRDALAIASAHARHMGDTVAIGKAQVRAYVIIQRCVIELRELAPTVTSPIVTFSAFNSGQSPARNFTWNITVEYANGDFRRRRRLTETPVEIGRDIPVGREVTDGAMIADMATAQINKPVPTISNVSTLIVMAKIDFMKMYSK
jgi:hypothetical protein